MLIIYNIKNKFSQVYKVLLTYVNLLVTQETLQKVKTILLYATIIIIFFPIKYFINNSYIKDTGIHSDFTSIFIYLSYFTIFLYIIASYEITFRKLKYAILLLLFIIIQSLINSNFNILIIEKTAIFTGLLLIFFSFRIQDLKSRFFNLALFFLIILQFGIIIVQFSKQEAIGLNLVGESPINLFSYGIAAVLESGAKIIRGYGTFPHPNVLGGMFVIISISYIYLLNKTLQFKTWILNYFGYILSIIIVFFTFSRAAILSLGLGLVVYFIITILFRKPFLKTLILAIIPIATFSLIFWPLYSDRITINDQATIERSIYNQTGINMLKEYPFFGVGPGQSILKMKEFSPIPLQPWQIQPIHNTYLLIIVEWGILGILLLYLLFNLYIKTVFCAFKEKSSSGATLIAVFTSILCLFIFDHYFYTNLSMQIVLTIFLAICYQYTKTTYDNFFQNK